MEEKLARLSELTGKQSFKIVMALSSSLYDVSVYLAKISPVDSFYGTVALTDGRFITDKINGSNSLPDEKVASILELAADIYTESSAVDGYILEILFDENGYSLSVPEVERRTHPVSYYSKG